MPHQYTPATGRELKYALAKGLAASAKDFLIECYGQDVSDDMRAIEDYRFEVHELGKSEFAIRAKVLTETGDEANRPALFFTVTITGGG